MLEIEGISYPVKQGGITFTPEKIWAKNTGRTTDGTMVGDIVTIKTKMQIKLCILSGAQVAQLDRDLSKPFVSVHFKDPRTNAEATKMFYAGTPSYPVYSYAAGLPEYVGVGVNLIEQ